MITTLTTGADWKDAGLLRERLAEIRASGFVPLPQLALEVSIVRALVKLTGRSAEDLRRTADEDILAGGA
jgi:hypothetical protein